MIKYIYQYSEWPQFIWDASAFSSRLAALHQRLGFLLGKMQSYGFQLQDEAVLRTLTLEVVKNSEIESELLDADQVRSSIARRLGIVIAGLIPSDRFVDGVVEMTVDATQHFEKPLSKERIFAWHAGLFPESNHLRKLIVGRWRDDQQGPMQVVSGPIGRERIHFEAPPAKQLNQEMKRFFHWFDQPDQLLDPLLKAGIAHLWFITLHPFDDGNGRIARAITDLQLARNDQSSQRFYSMSAQIRLERQQYYSILENTQKNNLDITLWLDWFLACLDRALQLTETTLAKVLQKANFWGTYPTETFNYRQQQMINKLLDDFSGHLTTKKWAKITKCSHDTALRDIQELIHRGILMKNETGGRSTHYSLRLK